MAHRTPNSAMKEVTINIEVSPRSSSIYGVMDIVIAVIPPFDNRTLNLLINPNILIHTDTRSGVLDPDVSIKSEGMPWINFSRLQVTEHTVEVPMSFDGVTKAQVETGGKTYQLDLQAVTTVIVEGKEYPSFIVLVRDLSSS